MNDASRYLRQLAQRVSRVCVEEADLVAVLLTGSAAEGEADVYSDIDLITYCDVIPPPEQRDRVRERIGGQNCVALVETHLPEADTSAVRRSLGVRRLGWSLPVGWEG